MDPLASTSAVATPTARAVAELKNVERVYQMGTNQVRALDDITCRFNEGDYWAIMGSSGSGKSTMLNLLGCIDRPTGGEYFVGGTPVSSLDDDELSELRGKHIGFIFQSFNLIPQLNVLENILVPRFYLGDPGDNLEDKAMAIAERVGLGSRVDHKPRELSGGQQQRVAIARALINDPSLLLADEATGNLDTQTTAEILELFDELHADGMTILLVTHENEVGERAEQVMRLKDGNIESLTRNRHGDVR
jgi:putative ABC transport system ATP-binding protein